MSHKILQNGLWGEKAQLKPLITGSAGESWMDAENFQKMWDEISVRTSRNPERVVLLHTGVRGREQFEQALTNELNSNTRILPNMTEEQMLQYLDNLDEQTQ